MKSAQMKKSHLVSDPPYADLHHVRTKAQRELMQRAIEKNVCMFCPDSLEKFHERPIIKRNKSWLVTENKFPYAGARVHLLIIHRQHIEHIRDIRSDGWRDLGALLSWMSNTYNARGGSFFFRFGDTKYTGATISHVHGHFILGVARARAKGSIETRLGYKK